MNPRAKSLKDGTMWQLAFVSVALALGGLFVIYTSFFSRHMTPRGRTPVDVSTLVFGLVIGLLAWLPPFFLWVLKRKTIRLFKQVYRSNPTVHGRLHLEVNEEGIDFTGACFPWKVGWPQFTEFAEDRKVFILRHRNPERGQAPLVFHILPKRTLSQEQITTLRQYLQRNIRPKSKAATTASSSR